MGSGVSATLNKDLDAATPDSVRAAVAELPIETLQKLKKALEVSGAKPSFKLIYLNARGISELTRCLFAVGKLEYEDYRFDFPLDSNEAYQAAKNSGEFDASGGLPCLEYDGVKIGGYMPIYRCVAKAAGLMGSSFTEEAQIDMLVSKGWDIRNDYLEKKKDEEQLKTWYEQAFPESLRNLEKQVPAASEGPFLVGTRISFADIFYWRFFKDGVFNSAEAAEAAYAGAPPKIKAAVDAAGKNPELMAWLAKRPQTEF